MLQTGLPSGFGRPDELKGEIMAESSPLPELRPEHMAELARWAGLYDGALTPEDIETVATVIECGRGGPWQNLGKVLRRLRTKYSIGPPRAVAVITHLWHVGRVRFAQRGGKEYVRLLRRPAGVPDEGTLAVEEIRSGPVAVRLMNVFTNGLADERFDRAANVLQDDKLTVNGKLTKIHE